MLPPIYSMCNASAEVKSLIGEPPRIYEFGRAPEKAIAPYVIWKTVSGFAENVIDGPPDGDYFRVQFDCYGASKSNVINVAKALRAVVETVGDIASYNGEGIDPDTGEPQYSFDANFAVLRQ